MGYSRKYPPGQTNLDSWQIFPSKYPTWTDYFSKIPPPPKKNAKSPLDKPDPIFTPQQTSSEKYMDKKLPWVGGRCKYFLE